MKLNGITYLFFLSSMYNKSYKPFRMNDVISGFHKRYEKHYNLNKHFCLNSFFGCFSITDGFEGRKDDRGPNQKEDGR